MRRLRAGLILVLFFALTLPLMPIQLALVYLHRGWARRLPHWYHQRVCALLGVCIHVEGVVPDGRPALLISNHVSWLDIPVLSAVAPVSFVAKQEVGTWPFVSWLAKLQRSVFVDREKRGTVAEIARAIMARLHEGDSIVLFAEGTSSDGNCVLPFRTSLFGAVVPSGPGAEKLEKDVLVQTLAIAYTRLHGMPLGRQTRPYIAWYGDMDIASHAWELLKRGPLDVHIRLSDPIELLSFKDRKSLARHSEQEVRGDVAELLYPRP